MDDTSWECESILEQLKERCKMSNQTEEQLELVKRSLEKIIAELEKIHESVLAMRWLCSYELENTKQSKK